MINKLALIVNFRSLFIANAFDHGCLGLFFD